MVYSLSGVVECFCNRTTNNFAISQLEAHKVRVELTNPDSLTTSPQIFKYHKHSILVKVIADGLDPFSNGKKWLEADDVPLGLAIQNSLTIYSLISHFFVSLLPRTFMREQAVIWSGLVFIGIFFKIESYFSDRLTFSNIRGRTSCRICTTARSRNVILVEQIKEDNNKQQTKNKTCLVLLKNRHDTNVYKCRASQLRIREKHGIIM